MFVEINTAVGRHDKRTMLNITSTRLTACESASTSDMLLLLLNEARQLMC